MAKKKRPDGAQKNPDATPVLHGTCFTTFIDEARKLGNEVVARREFCTDAVTFLKEKGLFEEWDQWCRARRARP